MELGGNAPFIVFADADLDAAVEGAMVAKMRHSAEACTAANRFFIEAPIADAFTEQFAAAMAELKVGNGFEEGVTCGPMINAEAIESIDGLVKEAVSAGASAALGGSPVDRPGFFYQPTVLAGVAPDSSITREEIFGAGRADHPVHRYRHDDRAGQRHRDGPHRICVHRGSGAGSVGERADPGRHDRTQPRRCLRPGRAVSEA